MAFENISLGVCVLCVSVCTFPYISCALQLALTVVHGKYVCMFCYWSGDPVSMDLDRQREWDEAVRLHFYNQESELLLHGELSRIRWCVLCGQDNAYETHPH